MGGPFVGSEAIAAGLLTRSQLAARYTRLFRDVYVNPDTQVTAALRAKAGWLWAKRQGVVAGFAAAALHGSKWVGDTTTVELFHENRHRLPGLRTRGDRIGEDEIVIVDGVPVSSPTRTALDLGCWYPTTSGVAAIDALARATHIKAADVELLAQRYPGRRGIARARLAISLFRLRSPVSERDVVAARSYAGWIAAAADANSGVRRIRQCDCLFGHGVGGRQSCGRV
jgi:hypothetical protein